MSTGTVKDVYRRQEPLIDAYANNEPSNVIDATYIGLIASYAMPTGSTESEALEEIRKLTAIRLVMEQERTADWLSKEGTSLAKAINEYREYIERESVLDDEG